MQRSYIVEAQLQKRVHYQCRPMLRGQLSVSLLQT